MLALLKHVSDQAKYIAHGDRQNVQIKDFLSDMHFLSPKAYDMYASDLLKKQIETFLGKKDLKDTSEKTVIDWQLGYTRTNPMQMETDYDMAAQVNDLNTNPYHFDPELMENVQDAYLQHKVGRDFMQTKKDEWMHDRKERD